MKCHYCKWTIDDRQTRHGAYCPALEPKLQGAWQMGYSGESMEGKPTAAERAAYMLGEKAFEEDQYSR